MASPPISSGSPFFELYGNPFEFRELSDKELDDQVNFLLGLDPVSSSIGLSSTSSMPSSRSDPKLGQRKRKQPEPTPPKPIMTRSIQRTKATFQSILAAFEEPSPILPAKDVTHRMSQVIPLPAIPVSIINIRRTNSHSSNERVMPAVDVTDQVGQIVPAFSLSSTDIRRTNSPYSTKEIIPAIDLTNYERQDDPLLSLSTELERADSPSTIENELAIFRA